MRILLNEAMKIEREDALAAGAYQRTPDRKGYANGFKPKTVDTRIGRFAVDVPQVRGDVEFYPSALEKGCRSERALKVAIAEMYVKGISTRRVTGVLEKMCGLDVSSTQVSRAAKMLDEELNNWRNRKLGEYPYLILDAHYEKVRQNGSVQSCSVFTAIGVNTDGKREILGVSVSLSTLERVFKVVAEQRAPWCQTHNQRCSFGFESCSAKPVQWCPMAKMSVSSAAKCSGVCAEEINAETDK